MTIITLEHPTRCTECKQLVAAGVQLEASESKTMFGNYVTVYSHADRVVCKDTRRRAEAERQVDRELAAAAQAHRATLATDKQVRYAMFLQDSASPFERHTEAQLAAMTRTEISQLIDMLRSNG